MPIQSGVRRRRRRRRRQATQRIQSTITNPTSTLETRSRSINQSHERITRVPSHPIPSSHRRIARTVVKDILVTLRRINASVCAGARKQITSKKVLRSSIHPFAASRNAAGAAAFLIFISWWRFFVLFCFLGFVNREIG